MSDRSHFDNEITITPPLTWTGCRVTPGSDDVQIRIHEEITDGESGQTRVLTGVAIVAKKFAFGPQLPSAIQAIIDSHPKHEFSGFIEEWLEPGYRELPRRYVVRDRKVVCVKAEWPAERDGDVRVGAMPTCCDALPAGWIHGANCSALEAHDSKAGE